MADQKKGPDRKDDISEGNKTKKRTERAFDGGNDTRSAKTSGKYPNYHVFKTRSGHNIFHDDSEDTEDLTIQHRSGSAIQFMPNGAIHMTSHNGRYNIVFGEDRMTVTGAHDLSVKGDGSLRVYGDYRKTVHGNVEISATGSIVHRGKNILHNASENHSIISQTITHKASDAVQVSANKHASFLAENTVIAGRSKMFAGGKEFAMEGVDKVSIKSSRGVMQVASAKDYTHQVGGDVKMSYAQKVDEKIGDTVKKEIGKDRNLSVGGKNVQSCGKDCTWDIGGTGKMYTQKDLHFNGPQGDNPDKPGQVSLFDILSNKLQVGDGQKPTDDSQLA